MVNVLAQIEMGSTIVAVTLLVLIGAIMVTAIVKYKSMDEILKLWAGLGTLVGLVVGTMGTYFFTKDAADRTVARVEAEKTALSLEYKAAKDTQDALVAKHHAETKVLLAEKAGLEAKLATADMQSNMYASRILWATAAPAAAPANAPEPPAAK